MSGGLTVVFQPQIDVLRGTTTGAEALVRWRHPELGPIGPDEFVPLAESSGLVQSLTLFVLDESVAQCRRWLDAGLEMPVSVNLSARNLSDEGLVEQVSRAAERHAVPSRLITLEVTETAVMTEPARAVAALQELRGLGFRVSIDDFGTGHSSLAYLRELPADEVKLDRAFTAGLADGRGTALVRAAIDLAHALELSLVAEGVEDAETLRRLGELGADVAQGYHICRPSPPGDLTEWLRAHAEVLQRAS